MEASRMMKGMLEGLGYIHKQNLIHRDLKTENILLKSSDDLSSVKIADFGLSAKFERILHFGMDQQCGTMVYMAPEILIRQDYSNVGSVHLTLARRSLGFRDYNVFLTNRRQTSIL